MALINQLLITNIERFGVSLYGGGIILSLVVCLAYLTIDPIL